MDDAILHLVLLVTAILAPAPRADHPPEAALVLVMIDLVPRHGHLAALIARDCLMSAELPVLVEVAEVNGLPAFVWAWPVGFGAVLLDVRLKLIQWDLLLATVIGTPECRVLQYLLRKEVDVVGAAKHALAVGA